ncbi:hypothetical protein SLE2022_310790 [Rubroshorea leprosula]
MVSTKRKPFKFFNFWAKHEVLLALVKQTWDSTLVIGFHMFQLYKKLKALKPILKNLNKKSYGDVQYLLQQERDRLHLIQSDLLASPNEDMAQVVNE